MGMMMARQQEVEQVRAPSSTAMLTDEAGGSVHR